MVVGVEASDSSGAGWGLNPVGVIVPLGGGVEGVGDFEVAGECECCEDVAVGVDERKAWWVAFVVCVAVTVGSSKGDDEKPWGDGIDGVAFVCGFVHAIGGWVGVVGPVHGL